MRGIDSRDMFRFHVPSRPLGAALKDVRLICCAGLARFAPCRTMLDDPIRQRLLEADVASGFFRFDPFVPENFLALRLKFAVKRRILQQIARGR